MNEEELIEMPDKFAIIWNNNYRNYYNQLRSGNTNMGYDQWKLTSEVLNNV